MVLLYLIISCLLTFSGLAAGNCGGLLDADNGVLEVQPSESICLWIIKLQNTTGVKLELQHLIVEPIIVFPEQNSLQYGLESMRIVGPKNIYIFEGQMLAIVAPPRNHKATLIWTGRTVETSHVTLNTKFEINYEGKIQWKRGSAGIDKMYWAVEPQASGQFNWELKSHLPYCNYHLRCVCVSFWVFHFKPDGSMSRKEKTCELSSTVGSLKVEKNSKILVFLQIASPLRVDSKLQVTWESDGKPTRRNVTGILVGTEGGMYVVTLNPPTNIRVYPKHVYGLAFDWNSEKIYWAERGVGIMRANVDGSDFEQLIVDECADTVGIEPITGNLYYGTNSRKKLRVCNNNGKKCSSIASVSGTISEIGLHSSKGFLFWSIQDTEIVRSNLDGSNMTDFVPQKSYGISVDESEDRLYTFNRSNKQIISYDLNGQDVRALQHITIEPIHLVMYGDQLYYSGWHSKSLRFIAKQETNSSLIANFINSTTCIALFGEQISLPRLNPCENSKCSHLCVLITASSFRCLCPDSKKLQADGISCGIQVDT